MTVIDSGLRLDARPHPLIKPGLNWRLLRLLVRLRQHRRAARTHIELSRLDDRLLYDIELEPLDLQAVLKARQPAPMLLDAMRRELAHGRPSRRDP